MAKDNKISKAYGKAISKRVPIMVGLATLILIAFTTTLCITTYINNKANPLSEYDNDSTVTIKETSIEWLNENKFVINDFFLQRFYLEDVEGNAIDNGTVEFHLDLGRIIDDNIVGENVSVSTYICYDWANQSFKTQQRTLSFKNSTNYTATNIDATFDKRPFFFKKVDLRDDVYFVTTFKLSEKKNGSETSDSYIYVVEHDLKDLVKNVTGGTSFQ